MAPRVPLAQAAMGALLVITQRGTVALLQIAETYAIHVGHHLAFVARKRGNLGA